MSTLTEALSVGERSGDSTSNAAAAAAAAAISAGIHPSTAASAVQKNKKSSNDNKSNDKQQLGGKNIDKEEDLDNKLCTFTITKKDFMNQHW